MALLLTATILLSWAVVNRPSHPDVPYAYQPLELPADLSLPDCRLLGLGSATHGNTEPVEAARLLLERLQADGGTVFLLEENVGDAARVNELHTFYDAEDQRHLGFFDLYNTQEMTDLLAFLTEAGIRLYGIDVQSISETISVLRALPATEGFPDPWRLDTLHSLGNVKQREDLLSAHLALLEELEAYWDQRVLENAVTESERAYASYLTGSIRFHYEYASSGRMSEDRDRLMAENALRVLELEETYYGTRHALLFASNGHVCKTRWEIGGSPYTPMGRTLAEALSNDYYVILTEGRYNTFSASNRLKVRRPFSIRRAGPLVDAFAPEGAIPRLVTAEELAQGGVSQWDLTVLGWKCKNAWTRNPRYFTVPMDLSAACDAVLLFRQLTPARALDALGKPSTKS